MQERLPMTTSRVSRLQKFIAILWPSFLTAIVATGVFFSAFDPDDLFPFGIDPEVSRLGIYTIGFLLFWLIAAVAGIGTLYFAITNCMRQGQEKQDD
jgi:hypothetical protein